MSALGWILVSFAVVAVVIAWIVWGEIDYRRKDPGYDKRMSDLDDELRKKEGRD